jgi:hypothetical protein
MAHADITPSQFVAEFCQLSGISESERVIAGTPVDIDDVRFTLAVSETDQQAIIVYAEFGEPPLERTAEVALRLMEHNYLSFEKGASFTFSPFTATVVYIQRIALAEYSPADLVQHVGYLVEKAKEWRATFFLDEKLDGTP